MINNYKFNTCVMKRYIYILASIFLGVVIISSCSEKQEEKPFYIAVSKAKSQDDFGAYGKWLHLADSSAKLIDMYHLPADSALKVLERCSGLLLTGGGDVHPARYGSNPDLQIFEGIDMKRDALELELIKKSISLGIPILGVCRGLQILNVSQGGTLYGDLPTQKDTMVKHRCQDYKNCFHRVQVTDGSLIAKTSQVKEGVVNSNHHQGIRELAPNLNAIVFSEDGLIEAIEVKTTDGHPFVLGVQWHPERMDPNNPLSLPVAMFFLREAKYYKVEHSSK